MKMIFKEAQEFFGSQIYAYYFDIPFEETMKRHRRQASLSAMTSLIFFSIIFKDPWLLLIATAGAIFQQNLFAVEGRLTCPFLENKNPLEEPQSYLNGKIHHD